ncbi:MAG: O-antigen ligase family protein, partial [Anaerolineales bacterium]
MSGVQPLALPRARLEYLLREAGLFLVLSYVLLLGGTFNGLVLYRLNVANLVVMALLGAAWLGWRWRRAASRPAAGVEWGLAAVVAAAGLATVFSADPRRSAGSVLLLVVYFLVYYLTTDLLAAGWPAGLIARGLLFAGSFVIAFGLLELAAWYAGWLAIGGLQDPLPPATLRVRAFLGHPNFVAALFSMLLPLALGGVLLAHNRASRGLAAAWVIAAAVIVYFTSSRGGWLGTAAGVAALIVPVAAERRGALRGACQALRRRPWAIAALGLFAVAAVGGAAALVYVQSRHPSHAGRDYIWEVAWEMFQRHPLTGNGPFTYGTEFIHKYSVPPEVLLAHAHNVFINTLAETGLVGGAAWAVLGLALARAVWRRWQAAAGRERL